MIHHDDFWKLRVRARRTHGSLYADSGCAASNGLPSHMTICSEARSSVREASKACSASTLQQQHEHHWSAPSGTKQTLAAGSGTQPVCRPGNAKGAGLQDTHIITVSSMTDATSASNICTSVAWLLPAGQLDKPLSASCWSATCCTTIRC